MTVIHPVVLCGGNGTRLWPLSRKALPKQFAPLIGQKSLLHLTLERLKLLNAEITCVAAEEHRFMVQEAMETAAVQGRQLLEPMGRNTAPAMALAALMSEPDALLLFAPADHHIPDAEQFAATVRAGVPAALAGQIVTFGVVPTFPSAPMAISGRAKCSTAWPEAMLDAGWPPSSKSHLSRRRRSFCSKGVTCGMAAYSWCRPAR